MDEKIIEVKEVDEGVGYLYVDGLTLEKGVHRLWNYEEIKDGPDFKRYVASGRIVVLDTNP
jgi:hypothetical protein